MKQETHTKSNMLRPLLSVKQIYKRLPMRRVIRSLSCRLVSKSCRRAIKASNNSSRKEKASALTLRS